MTLSKSISRSHPHQISIEVPCMIFIDNALVINTFTIKIGFLPTVENRILNSIAFEKIEMFFDLFVQNAIMIDKKNQQEFKNIFKIENNLISTPGMPNDQVVGSLLYLKLSSIVGSDLDIEYLTLSSELGKNITYTFDMDSPELEVLIPDKNDWWEENVDFMPWWHRSDTATYDMILDENDIYQGDISWSEFFKEELEKVRESEKTAKGKLKIIAGGKDEIK